MKNLKKLNLIILLLPLALSFINCKAENISNIPSDKVSTSIKLGALSGIVRDYGKLTSVQGTEIQINGKKSLSDIKGFYELKELPFGKYTITLTKTGFENLIAEINITGKIKKDFFLKVKAGIKEKDKPVIPSIQEQNSSAIPVMKPTVEPTNIISFPSIPPTVIPSPVNNPG
jgi:hypothetical protein